MNPKRVVCFTVSGVLFANETTAAFQSSKECPTPNCLALRSMEMPDPFHTPSGNSNERGDYHVGDGFVASSGNNNNTAVVSVTGEMLPRF